ncbi:MAG: YbaK/EbsC family protein [Anaerolineae bacterium]
MRLSALFGRTLRDAPADLSRHTFRLMTRAGLARQLSPGRWGYLPLGWRVMRRLESLIRDVLATLPAQEVHLPTGFDPPDAFARLARHEVESYKDLPRFLFHMAAAPAVFTRPAGAYGCDLCALLPGEAGPEEGAARLRAAVLSTIERLGVTTWLAEAAPSESSPALALMLPHPQGQQQVRRCTSCEYTAVADVARFRRGDAGSDDLRPLEKVSTPDCKTIADLCAFLGLGTQQTLKAVFYTCHLPHDRTGTILVMLRGDLDVSEAKLLSLLRARSLEPASEEAIRQAGAVPGYASPIGLRLAQEPGGPGLFVVGDLSLETMANFATGANQTGYHYINANFPRDFSVSVISDVALAPAGAACPLCGAELGAESADRLGMFHAPAPAAGVTYLSLEGRPRPVMLAFASLDMEAVLAAVVERHHDTDGIIWPRALAPYDVHLVALTRDEEAAEAAERLYADLSTAGIDVLYDDRGLSPGVMFADADLIGIPLRLTISKRSLEGGGVELKWRDQPERSIVRLENVIKELRIILTSGRPAAG